MYRSIIGWSGKLLVNPPGLIFYSKLLGNILARRVLNKSSCDRLIKIKKELFHINNFYEEKLKLSVNSWRPRKLKVPFQWLWLIVLESPKCVAQHITSPNFFEDKFQYFQLLRNRLSLPILFIQLTATHGLDVCYVSCSL